MTLTWHLLVGRPALDVTCGAHVASSADNDAHVASECAGDLHSVPGLRLPGIASFAG